VSPRVLFTCWPFEGHVFPLLSIALAERRRGGEVAFYTGRRGAPIVHAQGVEVFGFDRVEGVWNRVHERERVMRGHGQSLRVQREAFREWLVESIPDQVADLREVIARWRPDVIVTDGSMWGPSLVLHETAGIPVVFASTLIYALLPGPDAPPPGSRMTHAPRTASGRALAWGVDRMVDLLARGTRQRLDQLRASHGLAPLGGSINAFMGRLPLYLVGSVPELDLMRRDLPANVHYVGPLTWHPPESSETIAWLDQLPVDAPWVHVTEGTSHYQNPFLLRAAARGLAGAPVRAILTTGSDRDPAALGLGSLAHNVHLTRWLSHTELLPRCRVVVTTGGAQTIVAALRAGVPLVIVPTGWDKPANAGRAVAAGVAVRLSPRRCTPERLRAAVTRVLGDPRYRRAAAGIAEKLAAAPGPAGAAELLAGLAPGGRPQGDRLATVQAVAQNRVTAP
jgi:MGT family glycosyltransferase